MASLAGLAIFSGLSLNLLLQFAIGVADNSGEAHHRTDDERKLPFIQLGILFVSVSFLWTFFNNILPVFWNGFLELFLYFPLSALVCMGLELLGERVIARFFPKSRGIKKNYSAFTAYDGLVPASLMITSAAAWNFGAAFVLALFFAVGNLTAILILNEIRRRSALEWIPRFLRGSPLLLVSMGLLSAIFASAAGICFKILEGF